MSGLDWRQLERFRRLMHPEMRGVQWTCDHLLHDDTAHRGPLKRSQGKAELLLRANDHHPFAYRMPKNGAA